MKNESIDRLIDEIEKTRNVLTKIHSHYQNFKQGDFLKLGKTITMGNFLGEIICDYYTCLETLFFRIVQFFENHLDQKKWHRDLLRRMTLEVKGIRIPLIGEPRFQVLFEFLKFRHFKRYYYELEYDWDKLEFLEKKYLEVRPQIFEDIKNFESFLEDLKKTDARI